jgi:hypothetical protein
MTEMVYRQTKVYILGQPPYVFYDLWEYRDEIHAHYPTQAAAAHAAIDRIEQLYREAEGKIEK